MYCPYLLQTYQNIYIYIYIYIYIPNLYNIYDNKYYKYYNYYEKYYVKRSCRKQD